MLRNWQWLELINSRYFPEKSDNSDNAWAYRFNLAHKAPSSDLLKGKTLCIKDNICVAGVP
jgi:amidase